MAEQQTTKFTYVHAHRILLSGMRVTTHCGIKLLETMRHALDRYKLLDRFLQGLLGHFLKIYLSLHLTTPQLIYHVLLREVTFLGTRHDEMWFEIGGSHTGMGGRSSYLLADSNLGLLIGRDLKQNMLS